MRNVLIVGGGFAGLWAAMAAALARDELGLTDSALRIGLVSRDPWLTIRPRLYEADLSHTRVRLDSVLRPIGVDRIQAEVTDIDTSTQRVSFASRSAGVSYDALVMAAGSQLRWPEVPGLREHAFCVDTHAEATKLDGHLRALGDRSDSQSRTAVVVGSGFTGLEVATELVGRLGDRPEQRLQSFGRPRVILLEREEQVAPTLGDGPRPWIQEALATLGIELRVGETVVRVDAEGLDLEGGEAIASATTVWTGGFRASPLTEQVPVEPDPLGRLPVDGTLAVEGIDCLFAAGDVARAWADEGRPTLMSCQHAIPMGMVAGHNAVSELFGMELREYSQPDYVTCLDLGPWGALFMQGWDRQVRLAGQWAKVVKQAINRRLIQPPRSHDRRAILEAVAQAAPVMVG